MSVCADKNWNNVKLVRIDPLPSVEEIFSFKDVAIVNEIITGKVYDKDDHYISGLSGTCSPFDSRENVARLSFFFTAPSTKGGYVDIVLSGLGYNSPAVFRGGFVALAPSRKAPPAKSKVAVNFDVGDTGTGTGMQAG